MFFDGLEGNNDLIFDVGMGISSENKVVVRLFSFFLYLFSHWNQSIYILSIEWNIK